MFHIHLVKVDVAMAPFEGGCLVVVHADLSVDVWGLVMIDSCWTAEGLVRVAGFSCFTEEVCLAQVAFGLELAFLQLF